MPGRTPEDVLGPPTHHAGTGSCRCRRSPPAARTPRMAVHTRSSTGFSFRRSLHGQVSASPLAWTQFHALRPPIRPPRSGTRGSPVRTRSSGRRGPHGPRFDPPSGHRAGSQPRRRPSARIPRPPSGGLKSIDAHALPARGPSRRQLLRPRGRTPTYHGEAGLKMVWIETTSRRRPAAARGAPRSPRRRDARSSEALRAAQLLEEGRVVGMSARARCASDPEFT